MKYENEYLPDGPVENKVFVLKNGKAVELDFPDDTDDPVVDEEEEPHVDYD